MTYTPKSDEQLAKEGLLSEGIYDFEIIETSDRPSKRGNDMFSLKLSVFDRDGSQRTIFDYIALGNNFGERKLRKAAVACGLLKIYESGKLTDKDFFGATGTISVRQQDGTADFPYPKNVVGEYLPRASTGPEQPMKPAKDIINDDIPF